MRCDGRAVAGLAVLLVLGACGGADERSSGDIGSEFPLTVENCARQVTIDQRPQRLLPNGMDALNLVAAAGGADRVVARAGEFGQALRGPARAVEGVELLDAQHDLSSEAIIATNAQLMISNPDYLADPGVVDQLSRAGITTLFASGYCGGQGTAGGDGADFDDVYADIELYGRVLGTADRAAESIAELRERVTGFRSGQPDRSQRSAAELQVSENVMYAAGNTSMEHTQLEMLGLRNVFGDAADQFIEPSIEELIARDPEVLILQYDFADGAGPPKTFQQARQEFLALPGVQEMQAVRDGAVVGVPVSETAADPRAVDGLATIDHALSALP